MHSFRLPAFFLLASALCACATPHGENDTVTVSIVGTNDIHGQLLPDDERYGLVSIAAYVEALRRLRRQDRGAVLVIDAGDMWQGTLDSNLQEGAPMIRAYNALGVDAAALGNHEFDFGPSGPEATPKSAAQDPRGALRQRAREARFPLLAANLVDMETGEPVAWDNVHPSVMLDAAGVKVGVIGVMTKYALHTTIAANVAGLRVANLVDTILREGKFLRDQGADLIVVAAHAGGECRQFGRPHDTSSCDMDGEIMRVAAALPEGFVDHIVAGHIHEGIAHVVNGISITSAYSSGRAFGRVDFVLSRARGEVLSRRVYPPRAPLLGTGSATSTYEGQPLAAPAEIIAVADEAADAADAQRQETLGVSTVAEFRLVPDAESALSNLVTTALLESFDADVAVHNVVGGIRKGLPAGELTFGHVYEMFPFDNLVAILELSGRDLKTIVGRFALRHRKFGFAGMRAYIDCPDGRIGVDLRRADGSVIRDDDILRVIANDFLTQGGDDILTPVIPPGGFAVVPGMPRTRDALLEWLRTRPDSLDPADLQSHRDPRWTVAPGIADDCRL